MSKGKDKDKKARQERKQEIERQVDARVQEHLSTLPPIPKSKPPKKKGRYSGTIPPEPAPALLDLIHNFLKDFKYIKAAHGVRTDNQKRPGHNMSIWKGTADNLPGLLEIYLQWAEQNPDLAPAGSGQEANSNGVEDSSSESDSSSGSDSESSDDEMSLDEREPASSKLSQPVASLKRKAAEISSVSSETSDSGSDDEDSLSESASDSTSDSESSSDGRPANKKRKFGEAPALRNIVKAPNSRADEDSHSDSDSSDSASEAENVKVVPVVHATEAANSDSDESSSESSSDSDSSDESDGGVPTNGTIIEPTGRDDSDTSATLPLPDFAGANSDSSGSSSSSDSDSDDESELDTKKEDDVLVFEKPLSQKAADRGETAVTTTIPASTQNARRLKKENVPFSRIPADIKVDPRFASNKYQSYDYADRAHQDLIVTKGKGFTKEKNKKKRGSYRGGMIDTSGGKGIKFDD